MLNTYLYGSDISYDIWSMPQHVISSWDVLGICDDETVDTPLLFLSNQIGGPITRELVLIRIAHTYLCGSNVSLIIEFQVCPYLLDSAYEF
jgi:hypothetical protein